uniref:Ig-like domain-containing protein n=1 Tax=Sphaeramia orbicularis TaxID=375764 RepID=A0A673CJY7_9TELE
FTDSASFFVFFCCFSSAQVTDLQQSSSDHQKSGFISANIGDSVSLQCFFPSGGWFNWYKQTVGQKPRLISTFYYYDSVGVFNSEFQNNPRFTLDPTDQSCHLNISDLQVSDSATYFCIGSHSRKVTFLESITVDVKTSDFNIQTSVHQSESESVHPGDSVTLNCTVHTGTCDGEHSVYWFKKSEDPQPGIIYTHGGTNDQCERKNDTQTHTCVYNLPILDVDYPHAGTYYCAVASCGNILFGNGTMLDIKDDTIMYYLSGAFAFTSILVIVLAFSTCMMSKKINSLLAELHKRDYVNVTALASKRAAKGHYKGDILQYAATLSMQSAGSRRPTDDIWSECVYFNIKQ